MNTRHFPIPNSHKELEEPSKLFFCDCCYYDYAYCFICFSSALLHKLCGGKKYPTRLIVCILQRAYVYQTKVYNNEERERESLEKIERNFIFAWVVLMRMGVWLLHKSLSLICTQNDIICSSTKEKCVSTYVHTYHTTN